MLSGTAELFFLMCTQLNMLIFFLYFYVFIPSYIKYWWESSVNYLSFVFCFLLSQEIQKEGVQHLTDSSKENLNVPKGQSKDVALNGQAGVETLLSLVSQRFGHVV